MGNIIEFKKKQMPDDDSYESPFETDDGYYCIDSASDKNDLISSVGKFWLSIVTGQKITEVFADDDGKIFFKLSYLKQRGVDFKDYIDHMAFLLRFLNNNPDIINKFMKDYDVFLEESGLERIIAYEK